MGHRGRGASSRCEGKWPSSGLRAAAAQQPLATAASTRLYLHCDAPVGDPGGKGGECNGGAGVWPTADGQGIGPPPQGGGPEGRRTQPVGVPEAPSPPSPAASEGAGGGACRVGPRRRGRRLRLLTTSTIALLLRLLPSIITTSRLLRLPITNPITSLRLRTSRIIPRRSISLRPTSPSPRSITSLSSRIPSL